jgi:hypothetical protein
MTEPLSPAAHWSNSMTDQHPITPPSELLQLWFEQHDDYNKGINELLIEAARYGAAQELLACGNYLKQCAAWEEEDVIEFYNYRRPKPPSLKKQALLQLDTLNANLALEGKGVDLSQIRRALEQLND